MCDLSVCLFILFILIILAHISIQVEKQSTLIRKIPTRLLPKDSLAELTATYVNCDCKTSLRAKK